MLSTALRSTWSGALLSVLLGLAASPAISRGSADASQHGNADAQVNEIADELLAYLGKTSAAVRMEEGHAIVSLDDLTVAAAERDSQFYGGELAKISRIDPNTLAHDRWILAGVLKHEFEYGSHANEDYWFDFAVTPYNGGWRLSEIRQVLAAQSVASAEQRRNYLHLLDEYARVLHEMAAKTKAQAARGIRIPQPAITGIQATFTGLRDSAAQLLAAPGQGSGQIVAKERKAFEAAVAARIAKTIVPAYNDVLAIFDAHYIAAAPTAVGLSQYPGGAASYQRRITYQVGLPLTPREIHERGLAEVEEIERKLGAIRARVGFQGDRAAFEAQLQTDPRFFAKTPEELEQHYLQFLARIEPNIPQYFSELPRAGYGVKRVDRASEAGMTFGYYQRPGLNEPRGYYRYNAADLDKRSLIMAPHLIYHELIPGHHFQVALMNENPSLHRVIHFLNYPAFSEGWAEYAAELAGEMGGYPSPYEEYGHLLTQQLMASRLVVDTGTNAFGWPIERAQQFLRAHGAESDGVAGTESLRYSTDLYGQALGYRLGYDEFWDLRRKADQALGKSFDIRDFHAAALGNGVMPLNVLAGHIDWFIAQKKHSVAR